MMTEYRNVSPVKGLTTVAAIGAVALLASAPAQGLPLMLANPSFESPAITPNPGSQDPADFVLPFIDGWDEAGPITNQQGFEGLLDTGVFINLPADLGGGLVIPPIANAAGNQLAFMQINTDAGVTEPLVSISQQASSVFTADTDFAFSIGIGPGVFLPPIGDTGNAATLVLSIGFNDPNSGDFISVNDLSVDATELNLDASLKDFTVLANSDATDALALGNEIVVKVTQVGGVSGGFNLDKARLAETILGDTNFDGDIDNSDLQTAIANYTGPSGNPPFTKTVYEGDVDGQGDVDGSDLQIMISGFTGPLTPTSNVVPAPEPGSLAILALAGALGLRRRR